MGATATRPRARETAAGARSAAAGALMEASAEDVIGVDGARWDAATKRWRDAFSSSRRMSWQIAATSFASICELAFLKANTFSCTTCIPVGILFACVDSQCKTTKVPIRGVQTPTFARIAGDRDDINAASRSLRASTTTGENNAFSFTRRARGAGALRAGKPRPARRRIPLIGSPSSSRSSRTPPPSCRIPPSAYSTCCSERTGSYRRSSSP